MSSNGNSLTLLSTWLIITLVVISRLSTPAKCQTEWPQEYDSYDDYRLIEKRNPFANIPKSALQQYLLLYLTKANKERMEHRKIHDNGKKRIGSEFLGKRIGSEFLGKRLGSEFLGKRIGSEFLGKRSMSNYLKKLSRSEDDQLNDFMPTPTTDDGTIERHNSEYEYENTTN